MWRSLIFRRNFSTESPHRHRSPPCSVSVDVEFAAERGDLEFEVIDYEREREENAECVKGVKRGLEEGAGLHTQVGKSYPPTFLDD